jgi:AcrR family transcriptional regulator
VTVTSARRIGTTDSKTRATLLDVAERLLLDEGYPAVTSRRLGREAGLSNQIVHYYFRTMDDLFLEVFRRRADEALDRFRRAMEADPSLRTVWAFSSVGQARFVLEFAALANHRAAIRDELAASAARFRDLQRDAIADVLAAHPDLAPGLPPEVVLLAMTGVGQVMAMEDGLGLTDGHAETVAFVEGLLDRLDGRDGGPA